VQTPIEIVKKKPLQSSISTRSLHVELIIRNKSGNPDFGQLSLILMKRCFFLFLSISPKPTCWDDVKHRIYLEWLYSYCTIVVNIVNAK
jgi:hypothetical protein